MTTHASRDAELPLSKDQVQQFLGDRYEVDRHVGAGGAGVVFLARDRKRKEFVAVKFLRPELAAAVFGARFMREIELGQRLEHPNVLPVYDSGAVGDALYYTMPFFEGATLRDRLNRERQLSIGDALRIARGVANALDYAHHLGVIHRDIKPENILIDHRRVVVADLGIARAMSEAGGTKLTESGMVLGTGAYMSPEQGTGDSNLTPRSDIYSLACVVYEMLGGQPPFSGPTLFAIIARHSQETPPSLQIVRPSIPTAVQRAVEKALAKVPADRYATAGEFVDALEEGARGEFIAPSTTGESARPNRARTRGVAALAGVFAFIAVIAIVAWQRAARIEKAPPTAFAVDIPPKTWINAGNGGDVGISQDGRSVAFLLNPSRRIAVRRLDRTGLVVFAKPKPTGMLVFSPTGDRLAYASANGPFELPFTPDNPRVEPVKLTNGTAFGGLSWGFSPDIVYWWREAFYRVSPSGGTPTLIAKIDTTMDWKWRRPTVLSDGKTIAFKVTPRGADSPDDDRLAFMPIDGGPRTKLDIAARWPIGYIDGILIFAREGAQPHRVRILAVKFDLARRKPIGDAIALIDSVDGDPAGGPAAALSGNGTLAYLTSDTRATLTIDDGTATTFTLPDTNDYTNVAWAPDGRHIAVRIVQKDRPDLFSFDVATHALTRLATEVGNLPAWTADGKHVAYAAWSASADLGGKAMWVSADGSDATPQPVPGTEQFGPTVHTMNFSPDGKFLVVTLGPRPLQPVDSPRAYAVPLDGSASIPLSWVTPDVGGLTVSPNGRWITYADGTGNVYVRAFPTGDRRIQVSSPRGGDPRWSADGRQIYYRTGRARFATATLDVSGDFPRVVRVENTRTLADSLITTWDIAPDGKHFVVGREAGVGTKLVVVTNWIDEVKAKLERAPH